MVRSVRDSDTAWHCGAKSYKHDKCRNDNSIGVEMCSEKDSKGQYYIDEETQNKTLEVVKWLMEKYGVPLENVVRHYDVTGKLCPEPFVRNQVQWLDFKGKLGEKKGEETEMTYNYIDKNMPDWARPTIQKLVNKGYLNGNEKGELGLNDTMLKIFVVNDRAGMYGE